MDFNKIVGSKKFFLAVEILILIVIGLLIFKLGVIVGRRQADFSFRWGENYHQQFGGPRGGYLNDLRGPENQDYIPGYGVVGTVLKTENQALIIKGIDNIEKTITVSEDTAIRAGRDMIQLSDLTPDTNVVIIGSPKDDGTIDAKFIRVFPKSDRLPPAPPEYIGIMNKFHK